MSRIPDKEQPHLPEEDASNFFDSARIGSFYKTAVSNPRMLELSETQLARWFRQPPISKDERRDEVAVYAREHGVEWIDAGNIRRRGNDGPYCLEEAPAPQLTWWFPYHTERQVIFTLAQALVQPDGKPTILEAGCGSGIVSRLLAAENTVKVVGVDPDMEGMGSTRITQTPGDVEFRTIDFWDVLEEFGPTYTAELGEQRRQLLQFIRKEYTQEPIFELFTGGGYTAGNLGDPARLTHEVEELQEVTSRYSNPSPVDIVLCSFMEPELELTVPIRDGIHPKAIIYVRPHPPMGNSGAGDFYFDITLNKSDNEPFELDANTPISFNPGKDYYTFARWTTPNSNDWHYFMDPPRFYPKLDTELVVQLRKDVALEVPGRVACDRYPFDTDFEQGFQKKEDFARFSEVVDEALRIISSITHPSTLPSEGQ